MVFNIKKKTDNDMETVFIRILYRGFSGRIIHMRILASLYSYRYRVSYLDLDVGRGLFRPDTADA